MARSNDVTIGGKTASSPGGEYDSNARVSFIGFGPVERPEYLVYVLIDGAEESPRTGGTLAAPISKEILEELVL